MLSLFIFFILCFNNLIFYTNSPLKSQIYILLQCAHTSVKLTDEKYSILQFAD